MYLYTHLSYINNFISFFIRPIVQNNNINLKILSRIYFLNVFLVIFKSYPRSYS